jgi:hypothetical protein
MGNLLGPVTLNGTTGSTQVTVVAPAGNNVLDLSATQLTGAGETINFNLGATLGSLAVDGSAGNNQVVVQGSPPGPLTVKNVVLPTTTAVGRIANPSYFGQPLILTASVSSSPAGLATPSGSVDFFDSTTNTDLGSVSLSGGSATLSTSTLPVGSQTITVSYTGAANFLASNGSATVSVVPSIYVLNPNATALGLSGNANLTIPGLLQVDSSSGTALVARGNAQVQAAAIQVAGQVAIKGQATVSPTPISGAASVPDPLAGLLAPTGGVLQGTGYVTITSGSVALNPGIYKLIKISGNASVTLNPGIYVIAGGGLTVTGNASLSGSGVLIYNAGSNYLGQGSTFGGISFLTAGGINLTPAATGPYAGIVIFQSRDNTRALAINAQTGVALQNSILYAPSAMLQVNGSSALQATLVVSLLNLSGNVTLTQTAAGSNGTGRFVQRA